MVYREWFSLRLKLIGWLVIYGFITGPDRYSHDTASGGSGGL